MRYFYTNNTKNQYKQFKIDMIKSKYVWLKFNDKQPSPNKKTNKSRIILTLIAWKLNKKLN